MIQRPVIILAGLVCAAAFANFACAQSNTAPGDTPAAAQTSTATGSAPAPAPAPVPAKKVWTNEDVPVLRSESAISTIGNSNAKAGGKPAPAPKNSDSKAYQAQIAKLQAEIPPIDAQIAELQAAIDGKPTGDAKTSQRPRAVKTDDWSVEMQQLEDKKDGILAQISALQDQARHKGVPANTLP
jgi:hypothetical protein